MFVRACRFESGPWHQMNISNFIEVKQNIIPKDLSNILISHYEEEDLWQESKFNYKENCAVIHTDEKAMPKRKRAWSSWNASIDKQDLEKNCITYWINLLQNLKIEKNIFLTLNPFFEINESKIIKKVKFTHPYFNHSAIKNQMKLNLLQNKKNILFCGSYFGYGFHEDGLKSTIDMLKYLND